MQRPLRWLALVTVRNVRHGIGARTRAVGTQRPQADRRRTGRIACARNRRARATRVQGACLGQPRRRVSARRRQRQLSHPMVHAGGQHRHARSAGSHRRYRRAARYTPGPSRTRLDRPGAGKALSVQRRGQKHACRRRQLTQYRQAVGHAYPQSFNALALITTPACALREDHVPSSRLASVDGARDAHTHKQVHATEHRLRSLGVARSHPTSVDSAQDPQRTSAHAASNPAAPVWRSAQSSWSLLLASIEGTAPSRSCALTCAPHRSWHGSP